MPARKSFTLSTLRAKASADTDRHRQLVVQLRKWDMKKFPGHATNTGGRIAPTVPHAQGDDPDDTNLFQSYLQRKTVSMAQVSGSNASTFLENSTATSSYIDMQSPFSQQHTPSIFGTELSMDMHEDTDALLVRSLWDESLDVATLDGSAGLSQNDVFYDDFGIDVPGAIGLVGGSEIDVSRELLTSFSGCRSCCDGSCMDK